MKLTFNKLLLAGLLSLLSISSSHAADVSLTDLVDLKADTHQAESRQLPILVMFSASYCGYCSVIKEEFLKPMLISGDYTDKVIIRVLEIDADDDIRDIDGKQIDPDELAQRYNIHMTPTLAFVGPRGNELTQKLIGLTTIDFYGGYLDDAIDVSLNQLRGNHSLSKAPKLAP